MVSRGRLEVSEMAQNPPRFVRVPGNFPTLRASNVFVTFDGGSFLLSAHDLRPAEAHDAKESPSVLGSYEVARLALSPATLVWLKQQIAQAEKAYTDALKIPLPDPQAMGDALNAAAALEELSKPRPPTGPSELS
jgi:hypothetical protein